MQIGTYNSPGTIGWVIALIVLIICVVLLVISKPLTMTLGLILIAFLALSRLL